MRTRMAALAAGLLLVSAPAFAAGEATRINSGARAPETTQGTTQGQNADGVNSNESTPTRTARSNAAQDSWNQNQSADQSLSPSTANPPAAEPGVNPQPDSGRSNGAATPAPY